MKEFFMGLLVLVMMGVFSIVGVLLLPVFLVLGIFLKILIGFLFMILVIWSVGKVTLLGIAYLKKDRPAQP